MFSPLTVKIAFYIIFQAFAVCLNFYYLIPRYLETRKISVYVTYFFAVNMIAALCIVAGHYLSAALLQIPIETVYGKGTNCFFYFFAEAMPSTLATSTLAMSVKLTINWIRTDRKKRALEKENLEAELMFLKNQFNPHFLFNSINSIFFLIHKNPDRAAASLSQFSGLLRHQLYECDDHQIPLKKELLYLQNFIELEKLRQNKNLAVTVETMLPDDDHLAIAPFILMTFVENAFKHVSKHSHEHNKICIKLKCEDQQFEFSISNTTSLVPASEHSGYSGIGLKNVKRRLDLIYPQQYKLDIRQEQNEFRVNLSLRLEQPVTQERVMLS
jgi:two-component system LytT family sensor kinase